MSEDHPVSGLAWALSLLPRLFRCPECGAPWIAGRPGPAAKLRLLAEPTILALEAARAAGQRVPPVGGRCCLPTIRRMAAFCGELDRCIRDFPPGPGERPPARRTVEVRGERRKVLGVDPGPVRKTQ